MAKATRTDTVPAEESTTVVRINADIPEQWIKAESWVTFRNLDDPDGALLCRRIPANVAQALLRHPWAEVFVLPAKGRAVQFRVIQGGAQ